MIFLSIGIHMTWVHFLEYHKKYSHNHEAILLNNKKFHLLDHLLGKSLFDVSN